jgi:hypothetical protein
MATDGSVMQDVLKDFSNDSYSGPIDPTAPSVPVLAPMAPQPLPPLIRQQPSLSMVGSFSQRHAQSAIWFLFILSRIDVRDGMLMLNKILKHPKLVDQEVFVVRVQFVLFVYGTGLTKRGNGKTLEGVFSTLWPVV